MANACRRYQLVASRSVDTVVDGDSQYAMFQLPNASKQAVRPALPSVHQPTEFLSPQIIDVSDPASVTITIDMAATVSDTPQLEPLLSPVTDTSDSTSVALTPRSGSLSAPSLHPNQSEDADRRTALLRTKILSIISSFLALCIYLAIQAGTTTHTSCESDCD